MNRVTQASDKRFRLGKTMITHLGKQTPIAALMRVLLALLLFAAFIFVLRTYRQTDLIIYYDYSLKLLQGQLPYVDFEVEYPPLALLPMVLPQLPSLIREQSLIQYEIYFFIQNAIFSYWIGKIILQLSSSNLPLSSSKPNSRVARVITFYTLLVVINLTTVFCRYDIFSALLTLLALRSALKNRSTVTGVWLGLGVAAKLYPLVLLPIFSLYYLVKRQYRNCTKLLLGSAAAVFLVFLPFALIGQSQFFSFLTYHKLRGLQMETIPSGLLLLMHKLGWINIQFELNYGAYHLVSPIGIPILKVLPVLNLILFGSVLLLCLNGFRQEFKKTGEISCRTLVTFIILTLLVFMITAKVFSPQYLVWILPFLALLPLRKPFLILVTSISVLTLLVYPVLFGDILQFQLLPILILNLRNLLVVILTLSLLTNQLKYLDESQRISAS